MKHFRLRRRMKEGGKEGNEKEPRGDGRRGDGRSSWLVVCVSFVTSEGRSRWPTVGHGGFFFEGFSLAAEVLQAIRRVCAVPQELSTIIPPHGLGNN